MWKVVALLLAVFVLGNLVVRYVRKNPLDPMIEGTQVVVESQDFRVRFDRNGQVSGTYFVETATSEDWTSQPLNARLSVHGLQTGLEYLHGYPDFHVYGSESDSRFAAVATPLALVAAGRAAYGDVHDLLERYARRSASGGERLCVTLSGDALSVAAAESLEDGHDTTPTVARENDGEPVVYVDKLQVLDCKDLLAPGR